MRTPDSTTPSGRVAIAIELSGKTLEQLAAEIGCTHATLSQWQTGHTKPLNAKAGVLQLLADRTGVELRWLLTGTGPRVSRYVLRDEMQRIATAMQAMEREAPQQIETVVQMVEAAARAATPKRRTTPQV